MIQFNIGEEYTANHSVTRQVREAIQDMYGGGRNGWDLQCTEGATYFVLQATGKLINWPVQFGRNGGKWDDIFEKYNKYSVSSIPTVGSTMHIGAGLGSEQANLIGHVAYVTAVLSDGSIKVKETNWPRHGIYNERTIPKVKWQGQYQARFVEYTEGTTLAMAKAVLARPDGRAVLLSLLKA